MASFNRVILLGNLTRDPQLKYLPSQTPVVEFGLAVNRKFKTQSGEQREDVTFIECAAFARTAELINQYCRKGNMLFVEGRLKFDTWEDKQGGGKRSKLSVVVENMQFMPRAGGPGGAAAADDHGAGGHYEQAAPQPSAPPQSRAPAKPQEPPFSEEQSFQEDDIPF